MADGLITLESRFSVKTTIDRLIADVTERGLTVFARIDHGGNATQVGLELRPTELVIFGNPKGGTPLMQDRQTTGIDLPVKALAWQDADGKVWLTYNDANWIAERHRLTTESANAVRAVAAGMDVVTQAAAGA